MDGASGSGASPAPLAAAPTDLAGLQVALQNNLNSLQGNEFTVPATPATVDTPIGTLDYTYTGNGFALCAPPVQFPAPNPMPVPPANRYGCVNALALTLVQTTPDTLAATFTVPNLFVDASITWERLGLFPSGTSAVNVNATSVTGSFTLNLVDTGMGTRQVSAVAPGSVMVALNNVTPSFSDNTIAQLAGTLGTIPLEPIQAALATELEALVDAAAPQLPPLMP